MKATRVAFFFARDLNNIDESVGFTSAGWWAIRRRDVGILARRCAHVSFLWNLQRSRIPEDRSERRAGAGVAVGDAVQEFQFSAIGRRRECWILCQHDEQFRYLALS